MSREETSMRDPQQAERIRRQYISRDKTEQLQRLDERVRLPGRITARILGIVGTLIFGVGMSLITVWADMVSGIGLSISGMLIALIAYPVYTQITDIRKRKYAGEIIRLSDEIMKERKKD